MTDVLYDSAELKHEQQFRSMEEYVQAREGKRVIKRVLIANNGIAAVKAIRSMKKWAYETFGSDKMVQFIVMATPEDIKANAEYIRLGDECINVPGGSNNCNYANVMLITEIAENTGADAVWAGWGHASENPKLPDALGETKSGVVWIGPPSGAMRALGDKIGSSLIAQSAGVPCVGWSGEGITVNYRESGIPEDTYTSACIRDAAHARETAERIGYPVMIKASEGGGGKGIRKVESKEENIEMLFSQVQGEVPGSPIFLMKLAPVCRHLEVQLLADEWGEAIAIFGRDCSIQRRCQKIIEEGPVVAAPPEIWRHMEQSAVALAKEVGYVGAGTVEYLYTPSGEYYFLELNPRLQVEHPVTELISGVNLPAAQLQVAMGIPLHRIGGVRRMYGEHPVGTSRIDFDTRQARLLPGHVIACRITAENPDKEFQPTSGLIQELNFRSTPAVWGYFSISSHGGVHEYSDSQFGHLFAVGETRETARQNMSSALRELSIRGDIRTTVEYLRTILETHDFKRNNVTTTWLETVMRESTVTTQKPETHIAVLLGALYRAYHQLTARHNDYISALDRVALPSKSLYHDLLMCELSLIYEGMKYSFTIYKSGPDQFDISLENSDWTASTSVVVLADEGLLVLCDGKKYVIYGQEFTTGLRLTVDGQTVLFQEEYDPTRLISSMQGKLVRWMVEEGTRVAKDSAVAEVEVMKMYLTLTAPEAGIITPISPAGSIIEAGQLLANFELDNPDTVQKAELFSGSFPSMGEPIALGSKASTRLRDGVRKIKMLLCGYHLGSGLVESTLDQILHCLRSPHLPLEQFEEIFSTITSRIPEPLFLRLKAIIRQYKDVCSRNRFYWEPSDDFPVTSVQTEIDNQLRSMTLAEQAVLQMTLDTSGLTAHLLNFAGGNHKYTVTVLSSMLEEYYTVEANFVRGNDVDEVLARLRHSDGLDEAARIGRANYQLRARSMLVSRILDIILTKLEPLLLHFIPIVRRLSTLTGRPDYAEIVLKCRQLVTRATMPSFEERRIVILTLLQTVLRAPREDRESHLAAVTNHEDLQSDEIIFSFLQYSQVAVQLTALEAYVRRVHHAYSVSDMQVADNKEQGCLTCKWQFMLTHSSSARRVLTPHPERSTAGEMKDRRVVSVADLSLISEDLPDDETQELPRTEVIRSGLLAYYQDLDTLRAKLSGLLADQDWKCNEEPVNVVYLAVLRERSSSSDDQLTQLFADILQGHTELLVQKGVRRVTFILTSARNLEAPLYFTFRNNLSALGAMYAEDSTLRHIEPSYAVHMQLARLSSYHLRYVPTSNRNVQLFEGVPKTYPRTPRDRYDGRRLFARVLIRKLESAEISDNQSLNLTAYPEMETAFVDALNSLEIAMTGRSEDWRYHHIFINVLMVGRGPTQAIVEAYIRYLARRYSEKIRRLHVSTLEFAIRLRNPDGENEQYVIFGQAPTREVLNVDSYHVVASRGQELLEYVGDRPEEKRCPDMHGTRVNAPYPITEPLRVKRGQAWRAGTAYCYDFLPILRQALRKRWYRHMRLTDANSTLPDHFFHATELILGENDALVTTDRPIAQNDIGMVAWLIRYKSVEFPQGREIVVIANDITFQVGTFGVEEDRLFNAASVYARERGLPRIYLSANSGARIGLAEELRSKFQIAWVSGDVSKGMDYLFLSEEDHKLLADCVIAERLELEDGEVRYVIRDIIGRAEGLGVENLSGSGLIAGETSLAYNEIFTLTVVTGRTVGIGAYLARLGQRVIQKKEPIILTGYNALNKLLGRKVYRSNNQLGGIDVMYHNGITHMVCDTDMEAMIQMLTMLSYVPARRGGAPAIRSISDPVQRAISFVPSAGPAYDPRWMLGGRMNNDVWESGFFDRGSFTEVLGGWARSIVAGRARLGGIPMGVIAVDPRLTESVRPADPASVESKEEVRPKAPLVWFPDSAFKTAQAIVDLKAEDLPLMLFANWRGFSGGQADMFDEVLKFGSMIVDSLREYSQPVFVYLPPHATLRGGAWVVVDSEINKRCIEMYAAPEARGGVLETEGTVDVKFKPKQLKEAMHRLDPTLQALDAQLQQAQQRGEDFTELSAQVAQRETALTPYYHRVSTHFCDLHDTPGRMKAKDVIRDVVPWESSREFFYWRLRHRLLENSLAARVQTASRGSALVQGTGMDWKEARALISGWREGQVELKTSQDTLSPAEVERLAVHWLTNNTAHVEEKLEELTRAQVQTMASNPLFLSEMVQLIANMTPEQRTLLQQGISKSLSQ